MEISRFAIPAASIIVMVCLLVLGVWGVDRVKGYKGSLRPLYIAIPFALAFIASEFATRLELVPNAWLDSVNTMTLAIAYVLVYAAFSKPRA